MGATVVLDGQGQVHIKADGDGNLNLASGGESGVVIAVERNNREYYEGSYTVTPSDEEQVLETYDKIMTDKVTIAAIPSNYGLITWDGAKLTVS